MKSVTRGLSQEKNRAKALDLTVGQIERLGRAEAAHVLHREREKIRAGAAPRSRCGGLRFRHDPFVRCVIRV